MPVLDDLSGAMKTLATVPLTEQVPSDVTPSKICILIHGTWDKHSAFAYPNSQFCRNITAIVGGCIFTRFEWSGRNSNSARLVAGARLRMELHRLMIHYPESSLFIIAHSHGGNIALYALKDEVLRQAVCRTICLSTPFLSPKIRTWQAAAFLGLAALISPPGAAFVYFSFVFLVPLFAPIMFDINWHIFLVLYSPILPGYLLLYYFRRRVMKLRKEDVMTALEKMIEKRTEQWLQDLELPIISSSNLSIVKVNVDEAYWWLESIVNLSELPVAIWSITVLVSVVTVGLSLVWRILSFASDASGTAVLLSGAASAVLVGVGMLIIGVQSLLKEAL